MLRNLHSVGVIIICSTQYGFLIIVGKYVQRNVISIPKCQNLQYGDTPEQGPFI